MNRMIGRVFALVLACALPAVAASEDADFFAPVLAVHEAQENVGLALLATAGGEVLSERHLGLAVVEHAVPVGPDTRFQVMSITKAFVGAALVKTLSAGLVDLDVPIQTYLPDYPRPENGELTLRALAAHTAGLPHLRHPERKALYVEHFDTARDALRTFRDLPLIAEPGAGYAYSSAGYTLIAAILEAVHDAPFPAVLEALVLGPLGLEATSPGDVLRPSPGLARNYSFIDLWTYVPVDALLQVPTWDFSFNPGGGNLVTTARDLVAFAEAFTGPGFLTAEELEFVATPLEPGLSPWGPGWFVGTAEGGGPVLSISGATPGVQAGLIVRPDEGLVVAALANAWGRGSAGGDLVVGAPQRAIARYLSAGDAAP